MDPDRRNDNTGGPWGKPTAEDVLLWFRYRQLRRRRWNLLTSKKLRHLSDGDFSRLVGIPSSTVDGIRELHRHVRPSLLFNPTNRKEFFLGLLTSLQDFDDVLEEADEAVANRFEGLGVPSVDVGFPVEWKKDFKSGKVWDDIPSHMIDFQEPDSRSDAKIPWELSRFHQAWWLGKGYWLTGRQEYASTFAALIEDWIDQNPAGLGINWAVPMEGALRACNWIMGYSFFADARNISPHFWLKFFKSLYTHGIFIEQNLEYALVRGNHFLSNVTALIFLGHIFSWTSFGRRWKTWGLHQIEKEMFRQVYADGVSYEKSFGYQRFIMELFYAPTILAQRNGHTFSDAYLARLKEMFVFLGAVGRPDGSMPMFGDADDGRLFRMRRKDAVYDTREALSVGSFLFGDASLNDAAGGFTQEALWLFGAEGFERKNAMAAARRSRSSRLFPVGGYAVLRSDETHVVVDVGSIGLEGKGGHGHNDTLSFEYWHRGGAIIVDPGTYAYTGDAKARQEFRSAFSHNALVIDHSEPARFAGLWRIATDATNPHVVEWSQSGTRDVLVAEHQALSKQKNTVIHRRRIEHDSANGEIVIVDEAKGADSHRLLLSFHLHPDCQAELKGAGRVLIRLRGLPYSIECSETNLGLVDGWYSPSYGVRIPCSVLRVEWEGQLPHVVTSVLRPFDQHS